MQEVLTRSLARRWDWCMFKQFKLFMVLKEAQVFNMCFWMFMIQFWRILQSD